MVHYKMGKKKLYLMVLNSCLECGHCTLGQFCMLSDRHVDGCKPIPDWCKLEDAPQNNEEESQATDA